MIIFCEHSQFTSVVDRHNNNHYKGFECNYILVEQALCAQIVDYLPDMIEQFIVPAIAQ